MTMYFSRAVINTSAGHSMLSRLIRDGYALHKLVWQLFPETQKRDFLYRRVEEASVPTVYVLSQHIPVAADSLWLLETKEYRPKFKVGSQFMFSLRANPVVSRKSEKGGRGIRHDVVMDAKRHNSDTDSRELEQTAGRAWLEPRSERNGFKIDTLSVDGYRQHRLRKSSKAEVKFSTLDFSGVLQITDCDNFYKVLQLGLGSAKGFGCGMMMIKPLRVA